MGSGIIFQVDKAAFEDKELLGDKHERGIQPDMGSLDTYDIAMDKQDVRRYNGQPV
jgi:hypothetical protein